MRIFARKYKWYKDLFFQCNVLFDKSIQNSMFDSSRNALSYFVPNRFCAKYVAIKEQEGKEEKICIAAFMKDRREDACWIAGFVPSKIQNKGFGIYGAVASWNELFKEHPRLTVFSASNARNTRAVRVTSSIGFHIYIQDERHCESSLTKEQFDNEFVGYIKDRYNIK